MLNNRQYRYPKSSRLTDKRLIDRIFREGNVDFAYPFRVVSLPYSKVSTQCCGSDIIDNVQILISVRKKMHRRAVVRNLLKRRCREAFRLNVKNLDYAQSKKLNIAFVYISKEELNYKTIENGMAKCIKKLSQRYSSSSNSHTSTADLDL